MGKAGYRKFLKKERAKVKLKGSKTVLPKGQNVTDTNFKVKKIIIKDQIKQHGAGEVLSKRKLNVKELLSRLDHYNSNVKQDSLGDLREIALQHSEAELGTQFTEIIDKVSKLTLDVVRTVRKEANKLLAQLLSLVSLTQLTPMFPSLCSYLTCGLTHIDRSIREDSLYLFDVLLTHAPKLCAKEAPKLLPICLDLFSQTTTSSRALSLNLDSKLTAEKWRGQVLTRIRTLLSAMAECCKEDSQMNRANSNSGYMTVNWNNNDFNYLPLYVPTVLHGSSLNLDGHKSKINYNSSTFDIKGYFDTLIPLLLDAFIEVVPTEYIESKETESSETLISVEASVLLQCIIDIIYSLWDILQTGTDGPDNVHWIQSKFTNLIMNRLITKRFPYATHRIKEQKAKKRKETETILSVFKSSDNDPACYVLNLSLSKLVLNFAQESKWKDIVNYLKSCLRMPSTVGDRECDIFSSCLYTLCCKSNSPQAHFFVNRISDICINSKSLLSTYLFSFLIKVALDHKFSHLQSEPSFKKWLSSLPLKLTEETITSECLYGILNVSVRSYEEFNLSLKSCIIEILGNIPKIKFVGVEEKEGQLKIAGLLYWVKDLDKELLNQINHHILDHNLDKLVCDHISQILLLK